MIVSISDDPAYTIVVIDDLISSCSISDDPLFACTLRPFLSLRFLHSVVAVLAECVDALVLNFASISAGVYGIAERDLVVFTKLTAAILPTTCRRPCIIFRQVLCLEVG